MITVVLADDHQIVRQGLHALLEAEPDLSIVGEVGDGLEAVDLVERLQPDVLIVDLMMPGLNGLEVTRQVRKRSRLTYVIILSMHDNEAYVLEGLRNGAAGYVLKESNSTDLVKAIQEVTAGRRFLSPPLSERAIEIYMQKVQTGALDPYETLTTREREILHLAVEGYSYKEIGTRLSISPRTAETHRANMMRKLGLSNQTELIRYAFQRGVIPLENRSSPNNLRGKSSEEVNKVE
jgi:two-component system response regulator NreC